MVVETPEIRGCKPSIKKGAYDSMLDQMREVAQRTVLGLRRLSNLLPTGVVEQVEHLHEDPIHERRKTVRFNDAAIPVAVEGLDCLETVIKDHCPKGIAICLPCPAGEGTVMRIRIPPGLAGQWVLVAVKHCRKEGDKWVAGCEVLSEQHLI
jgi:hypothetical protein